MNLRKYHKAHVRQHEITDCGVACLLAILRLSGGDAPLQRLREYSGTASTGTTMLGLLQAADRLGFKSAGFEGAKPNDLRQLEKSAILYVIKNGQIQHYVVFYGMDTKNEKFIIGDPADESVVLLDENQLTQLWSTGILLSLEVTSRVVKANLNPLRQRLEWVYRFVREDLNLLGSSLALGIAISIFGLSIAVFSQKLLDSILPAGDRGQLVLGVTLLLLLLLFKSLFSFLRQLFLLRQSKDFNIRVIDYFYRSLLFLPKPFFDSRKTGDLIARMNDTGRIQRTIAVLISKITIDILMVIVCTGALFYYSLPIGWISLIWIPVFTLIVYRFHDQIVSGQRHVMQSYALNESNYVDTIQGIGAIKVANKEKSFSSTTNHIYRFFQEAQYQLGLIGLRFNISAEVAGTIFIAIVILFSSLLVLQGKLTAGAVMAIIQLIGMAMASAANVAAVNFQLQEAKVAFDRMQEFANLEAEYDLRSEASKIQVDSIETLQIRQLNFRFTGRPRLLSDISLEARKGQIIAILGESGCGKSTLLEIMQGFYQAEDGKILINNLDFEQLSLPAWRSLLGVVPQQIKLFNGYLADNIIMDLQEEIDEEELPRFFEKYGFDHYFKALPNGYNTLMGEGGTNISGGQRQLVALARALYRQPQVLLLDEATAAMDRVTENRILRLLHSLKNDKLIIMVTHRVKVASIADHIYIIENGRITKSGSPEYLMGSQNFYSESVKEWKIIA